METVCCKPGYRWPVTTLPPRRFTDPKALAAFHRGWYAGSNRYVQARPPRGLSSVQKETSVRRTPVAMGKVRGYTPMPATGPHYSNYAEAGSDPSPRNVTYPGLVLSGVVLKGMPDSDQGHAIGSSSIRYLGSVREGESKVVPSTSGSQIRVSVRAAHRLQLADGFIERMGALLSGPGMHKAASLLSDFA